jgi:hypothetical protein
MVKSGTPAAAATDCKDRRDGARPTTDSPSDADEKIFAARRAAATKCGVPFRRRVPAFGHSVGAKMMKPRLRIGTEGCRT